MNLQVSYLLNNAALNYANEITPDARIGVVELSPALSANSFSSGALFHPISYQWLSVNQPLLCPLGVPAAILSSCENSASTAAEIVRPENANAFVNIGDFPKSWPSGNSSQLIAEWEGYVTEIGQETFEARLRGILGEGVEGELEEATIPVAEVTGPNKELFAVGALFRLCVSYEQYGSGQIRRYTDLVFRRLPAYRKQDLDAAIQRAGERLSELRLE